MASKTRTALLGALPLGALLLAGCTAPPPAQAPDANEPASRAPGNGLVGANSEAAAPAAAGAKGAPASAAQPGAAGAPGGEQAGASGPRAQDFELDALTGGSVRLSDHFGKDVVLIDFWATYCEPCLAAMPHLNELYREHKARGFVILGVSIDGPESLGQVRGTVSKLSVEFPILLDRESSVVSQYNPKVSAPYSVLIDRAGRVVLKQEGYTRGKAEALEAKIEQALAAKH